MVDWLPWNHTFGGNHNFGLVLLQRRHASISTTASRCRARSKTTVRNLREIAPHHLFQRAQGLRGAAAVLAPTTQLRRNFFSRLKVLFYAGAAWRSTSGTSCRSSRSRPPASACSFLTGLGSTETAPFAHGRMLGRARSANIGLPVPGVELKLVPNDGKLEARVRGPDITPGYWRQPELTAKAFDEEGFYKIGDALKFDDRNDPARACCSTAASPRTSSSRTGTWVSVGPLRARVHRALRAAMCATW